MTACQPQTPSPDPEVASDKLKPEFIEGEDYDEYEGAAAYAFTGDNPTSRFDVHPDFYDETETFVEYVKDSYFVNWLTDYLEADRPIIVE